MFWAIQPFCNQTWYGDATLWGQNKKIIFLFLRSRSQGLYDLLNWWFFCKIHSLKVAHHSWAKVCNKNIGLMWSRWQQTFKVSVLVQMIYLMNQQTLCMICHSRNFVWKQQCCYLQGKFNSGGNTITVWLFLLYLLNLWSVCYGCQTFRVHRSSWARILALVRTATSMLVATELLSW